MKRQLCLALTLTTAMVGTAFAQEPPGAPPAAEPAPTAPAAAAPAAAMGSFGQTGQIAIMTTLDDSDINVHPDVSFVHTSHSMNGGASTNNFSLVPTGHYFIMPNLSVSAGLIIQHSDLDLGNTTTGVTTLGLVVGAGYDLYLAPNLSIWPQLQIGYAHGSASAGGADISLSTVPLTVSVPVLWHPIDHFFLGLAPILRTQLTSSASAMGMSMDQSKQTDVGVTGVIGGYFGG